MRFARQSSFLAGYGNAEEIDGFRENGETF